MKQRGLIQAGLVTVYCSIVGLTMFNLEQIIEKNLNSLAPIVFLLFFSSSALICGLLVFYKPYLLFLGNKKKEAIDLVLFTALWLFVFFVIFLLLAMVR